MAINKMANALAILECLGKQCKTTDKIATAIGRTVRTARIGLKELEQRGLVRRSTAYEGNQLPWRATPAAKAAIFVLKEKGEIDTWWRGKMYREQQRKLFGTRLHLHVEIDCRFLMVYSDSPTLPDKLLDLKRL